MGALFTAPSDAYPRVIDLLGKDLNAAGVSR
jgi:hypothetical protein